MDTLTVILIVAGVLVVGLLVWSVATFNRLIRQRNQTRSSWAQIDVQLRRRFDLIPNLIETARAYMAHERQTLEAVINARARAVSAQGAGPAERGQASAPFAQRVVLRIQALQPYRAGDQAESDPLWLLHQLNISDKHKAISFAIVRAKGFEIVADGGLDSSTIFDMLGPYEHDTVIATFPPHVQVNADVRFTVVFDKACPVVASRTISRVLAVTHSSVASIVEGFSDVF